MAMFKKRAVAPVPPVVPPVPVVVPPPVTVPAPPTCSSCTYFLGDANDLLDERGTCRRFPPTPWIDAWLELGARKSRRVDLRAQVGREDWCGEYKERVR